MNITAGALRVAWKSDYKFLIAIALLALIPLRPIYEFPHFIDLQGGDAFHNIWIWSRNLANVTNGHLPWHANIMFPDSNSSLYSEFGFGETLLYGAAYALTRSDVFGYAVGR